MPKRTALEFYRKRQTVESLSTERPQSLKSVYDVINNAVLGLEDKLDMLLTSYYGADQTLDRQLKRWLPAVLLLMRQGRTMELACNSQIEEYFNKHEDMMDRSPFDQEILDFVSDVISHILHTVNDGFCPITSSVEELVGFMEKYLKSFSTAEGDRYLETCTNYEKQKTDLENAILLNIKNIFLMTKQFEEECLTMDHFDYISKERSERYGCVHVPILLVFPAACDNIRNAFTGIRKWLEADENYIDYLQNDTRELDHKRELQTRELKELQFKVSCHEYKFKSLKKELDQINMELDRLKSKETVINNDEKKLAVKHKNVTVDLEIKLYRLTELKQFPGKKNKRQLQEQLERLNSEISLLKVERPKLDRSLTDLQSKISWISERKCDKLEKESRLEEEKLEKRKYKKLTRKCEVEVMRLTDCIHRIKDIITKKSSEEILMKIFHNLPTVSKHILNNKKGTDKINKAQNIVARYIDNDWLKLYWQLPFYPTRGEETKRQDIEDITHNYMRHTAEDQAKISLSKWRRLHTRATLNDLTESLFDIKRKDIVDIIKTELKPRAKCSVNPKLYRTVHFPDIPVVKCHLF